jgi:transposase
MEVPIMAAGRKTYPDEFKKQLVEMARAGRSAESLARDFEPTAQTIRNWVKQADLDEGRRTDGLTTAEREELRRLRRENRRLQQELEIMGKAATWFAKRNAESTSGRRSRS